MEQNQLSERQLTMQAVRWLTQTAEALSYCITLGIPAQDIRKTADAVRICSDRAEHIAQYDIEGLAETDRMNYIANDLTWLADLLRATKDVLAFGPPYHLPIDSILELANVARDRATAHAAV